MLRDAEPAHAARAPYVAVLTASHQRVRLVGTTSSAGTEVGRLALSLARAGVVRDLLVAGGVDAGAVDAVGVGCGFPGFAPDRDGSGRLDPVLAARNRLVIIEPLAPPGG